MSGTAPFAARRYEIEVAGLPGDALVAEPLPESEAAWLGAAFSRLDPWASYGEPAQKLVAYLSGNEPGAPRFVLKLGTTIAGAAGVRLNWMRGPYIQFLAILPPFQRQGLGSAVLSWAEREARAGHDGNLWVAASEINVDALRLYARHGFERVASLDGLACEGRTEILLRKRL